MLKSNLTSDIELYHGGKWYLLPGLGLLDLKESGVPEQDVMGLEAYFIRTYGTDHTGARLIEHVSETFLEDLEKAQEIKPKIQTKVAPTIEEPFVEEKVEQKPTKTQKKEEVPDL